MGSTNKTAHYELPQFVANDKPSWLGDVNEAMEAIDTGIYGAKSSADGAQQTANNAVAGVQSAGTRMDGIQTQLDTVATQANQTATTVAGHTSSIATNSANINTLNSRMGSTDISAIGDGTVTGAISSIAQGGGGVGAWTQVDLVNYSGSSSTTATTKTVTADISAYKEFLIAIVDHASGKIEASEVIPASATEGQVTYLYATTANVSSVRFGNFNTSTKVLSFSYFYGAGNVNNDLVLYAR